MNEITLEQLLATKIENLSSLELVCCVGQLFDKALDENDVRAINRGLEIANGIDQINLTNEQQVILNYYLANGWASKRFFNYGNDIEGWNIDRTELGLELYYLRKCISIEGFDDTQEELRCQVFTNLGNHFSHVGQFIEALECWKKALEIIPGFPMALGNIGMGMFHYAQRLHQDSHTNIFIHTAYKYLKHAYRLRQYLDPGAEAAFTDLINGIETRWSKASLDRQIDVSYDLGKNKKLRAYREWGISNNLYLNPLNDIGPIEISSHDCLHLPSMTVNMGDKPKYHSLFNQIKQEYGAARFLYYEGTELPASSYSDRDILLVDTLDYADYSFNLEKVKISYRLIFSLFDKIAYLLNDYLEVGVPMNQTSFKVLWHEDRKGEKLRKQFVGSSNSALKALYWLSKDLFDKDATQEVIEPDAKELADIRNHIEHKSFKIKMYGNWGEIEDNFTYCIGRREFENKTLKQLKLVRSAIIYTSLAIHHEEGLRIKPNTVPMFLPDMPHDYKI